jgi:predicted transcriptional regulator
MDIHHGETIEKVVRRNGHSITDVAKLTKVNRRSVYNWFNQPKLKPEIIYKIGCVINHDFSVDWTDGTLYGVTGRMQYGS